MSEFDVRVCGIPCVVRVIHWERHVPARISGPPENCYPAEGGYGDYELLDRRGRPAKWLERKMTDRDRNELDEAVFNLMESGDDSFDDWER
jgi:hypothetical protein